MMTRIGNVYTDIRLGDVIAVRGTSWLSRGILKATGNTVSHVGIVTQARSNFYETEVLQALTSVELESLYETIAGTEAAWLLSIESLDDVTRSKIVSKAWEQKGDSYGYYDIGLQLADAVFRTRWFTDHLNVEGHKHPICSFVVARAYASQGFNFDVRSTTPADIFNDPRWSKRVRLK